MYNYIFCTDKIEIVVFLEKKTYSLLVLFSMMSAANKILKQSVYVDYDNLSMLGKGKITFSYPLFGEGFANMRFYSYRCESVCANIFL